MAPRNEEEKSLSDVDVPEEKVRWFCGSRGYHRCWIHSFHVSEYSKDDFQIYIFTQDI